jgi:hypothetical protein
MYVLITHEVDEMRLVSPSKHMGTVTSIFFFRDELGGVYTCIWENSWPPTCEVQWATNVDHFLFSCEEGGKAEERCPIIILADLFYTVYFLDSRAGVPMDDEWMSDRQRPEEWMARSAAGSGSKLLHGYIIWGMDGPWIRSGRLLLG